MGMGSDRPHSFRDGLKIAQRILSREARLVSSGLVETESEQIVLAAFRSATGKIVNRLDLFLRIDDAIPTQAADKILEWATLRSEGRILQHLTGFQAFLDHEYEVNSSVLVPRPETETLVATALDFIESDAGESTADLLGLEIGVGSGIISIELLHSIPRLKMIGTELVQAAREVALRNSVHILGKGDTALRFDLVPVDRASDVLDTVKNKMANLRADFLISNPPYLVAEKGASSEVDAEVFKHEPHTALFAPDGDPLYFYRKIAEDAEYLLKPKGKVLVEIPHERAQMIVDCFENRQWVVELFRDLNGRERVLLAKKKG